MATFTFRVPDSLAEYLISSQMRIWLEDFLREPHALPSDPGPGDKRVSLTLPQDSVEAVSAYLRCSTSASLRRIAAEQLGTPEEQPETDYPLNSSEYPDTSSRTGVIAGLLIHAFLWILLIGACFFFKSRKKRGVQEA
jgi:hypothetical protein